MAYGFDPSVLLQARGVQVSDPYQLAAKRATLADIAMRQQENEYNIRKRERDEAAANAIGQALGRVTDLGNDGAVAAEMQNLPPEVRAGFYAYVQRARKEQADIGKTQAETGAKQWEVQAKQAKLYGDLAAALTDDPSPHALMAAKVVAQRIGLDPSKFDPPPGVDPRAYYSQMTAAALDASKRAELAMQERGQNITVRGQDLTAETSRRGQDMTAETSRRGQNMTDARAREANRIAGVNAQAAMTGQPQEIMVDGMPTLAIYDKRSGTFFDANTRQPIKQGIGPKAGELPASTREKMAQNNVTLAKIDNALALVDQHPESFGLKNMLGDTIRQRTDPEGVGPRALISDIAGQKIHDRSGAAVTVGEMERLKPYIPNVNDDPATIKRKLGLFRQEYAQVQEELAAGRSVAELITRKRSLTKPADAPKGKGFSVTTPDGQTFTFPTESAAFEFKQRAGIK